MKRRVGLALTVLAISALACQTATALFQDGDGDQAAAVTAVAQPEASESTLAPPSAAAADETGEEIDPCSLLTEEQIASVQGMPVGEPVRDTHDYVALGPVPSCIWPEVPLEVSVLVPPAGQTPQEYYQEYIRRMDPGDFPTGLGDEAWGDPQDGEVLVRQGDIYFMVEEQTYEPDNYEQNIALAELVLENLP